MIRSNRLSWAVLLCFLALPAFAYDRPVTDDERVKLTVAVTAQGCTGGEMEFDDGYFEVDDARCADGRKYDLKFDPAFNLIEKELDD